MSRILATIQSFGRLIFANGITPMFMVVHRRLLYTFLPNLSNVHFLMIKYQIVKFKFNKVCQESV